MTFRQHSISNAEVSERRRIMAADESLVDAAVCATDVSMTGGK